MILYCQKYDFKRHLENRQESKKIHEPNINLGKSFFLSGCIYVLAFMLAKYQREIFY